MTFGQRLYELRRSKNISQEEFAELLAGVCLAAIISFIYAAGHEVGKFIYYLQNEA